MKAEILKTSVIKYLIPFVLGTLGGIIGFYLLAKLVQLIPSDFESGDRDPIFLGLYIGLPLGTCASFYLWNRIIAAGKIRKMRIFLGCVLSLVAVTLMFFLMDAVGSNIIIMLPLIVSGILVCCKPFTP